MAIYNHLTQSGLTPGPIFAPKAKYTVDVIHHSVALQPPRYVFASVNLRILPPGLVRQSCVFPAGLGVALIFPDRYSVLPCSRADRNLLILGSMSVHHRPVGFGSRSHLFASLIKSLVICSSARVSETWSSSYLPT